MILSTTQMIQYPGIVLSWLILSCFLCRHSLGNSDNNIFKCLERERKALLQFKDGITYDSCGLLTSWRDDTDCCQWRGVQCSNDTGHVIILRLHGSDLDHTCLEGNLSPSLGELINLRHLKLNFNAFNHPSLDFLGSLANLEHLSLGYMNMNTAAETSTMMAPLQGSPGQSLNWLSRLKLLRHLELNGADFSDAKNWMQIVSQLPFLSVLRMDECQLSAVNIPASLKHVNSSSNLRVISLSENDFNDRIIFQWLFNFPRLTNTLVYLDLSLNSIKGPIPNGFGNLQHLFYLDLSTNQLEGPVLKGFGNLKHISHLDLSNNRLEGPIPAEFRSMHSLSYFSLSYNNLQEGSVFEILTSLCNLKQLYLKGNNFTNELTDVIQALLRCGHTKLQILDLSQNHLWGEIPDTISSLSLLRELYLDHNHLNGGISQGIGQLAMLEKLDISSNYLKTTLTHNHFSNLSRLRELYLSDNPKIVMNIDASWDPRFQLDIISLRSCKLGPYFPNWLQMQRNFSYLYVSNAEISDIIPVSFWNNLSSRLQYLNMSYNQLRGIIPNLPMTKYFGPEIDLSSNIFEGVIPSCFTNASSLHLNNNRFSDSSYIFCPKTTSPLHEIDLSNNLLTGELPDCWYNFVVLYSLHLENNRLSGKLPKSIGALKNLQYLHLHNNSFSGPIPTSLENCSSLISLNLGYNSFTGTIPPWIGNVQRLGALILRKNHFLGVIPSTLCQLPYLQILDFAMNHISGVIPRCISNFTAMTGSGIFGYSFGDLSNAFGRETVSLEVETAIVTWKGEEYKFKESVELVKSIDLSFNELGGEIPDGIFNLTGLLSLDLSKNHLTGIISSKVGQLAALELLDLSDNHLTGEIPSSLANLSYLAILGLSNNNLSGKIPLGTQLQGFSASSYIGNLELCGAPLSTCPGDQAPVDTFNGNNASVPDEHPDNGVFPGLYISAMLGLIIGFWGVFGTLVIKNSWRYAWFRLLDSIRDRFYGFANGVIVAKAWRKH